MIKDKLIIKNNDLAEPLNSVLPDTFQEQKTVNQSWQLQFSAYDDHSVAFSLLQAQNSVMWRGQEFVIKQIQPTYADGLNTTQVTASHIGYEVQRIFQHKSNTGTKTYSVDDVLKFYLQGNQLGYSWEVIGKFNNQQIDNLGNANGQDMLSKITSTWSNAIVTFDNKKIKVFNSDDYYHDDGEVITYLGNSNNVQLNYDSTNLVNKLYCIADASDNNKPPFQPFYVQDDDSIKKYGVYEGQPISDNRFKNTNDMRNYAKTQLQPEPSLSIQVTFNAGEQDIDVGEIRTLLIPELNFVTQLKVTQITVYPIADTQQSQAQLDNTAKTILNYNQSLHNSVNSRTNSSNATNTAISNAIQNNQDQIDRINDSLKQQTQSVSNTQGSLDLTLNNNIVYVNCTFYDIEANSTFWNIPSEFSPNRTIFGSTVVNGDKNYIINYEIYNSKINIVSLSDMQGNKLDEIKTKCNGGFNYLV